MMKNLLTFACVALAVAFGSTTASAQNKNAVVLTVEDEQVTLADFEAVFRKNNRDTVVTAEALDEYMELFVNFKLKVREAREQGLDTASSFKRELDGYRKQLARPYLIDNELLDALVQEAYDRRLEEVRASHILINLEPTASPEDTLKAWNRIIKLRERILAGEDFAAVCTGKGGSEDPSARENKGDLGYFTSFQMVYPFETAAYTTPIGQISMPVRSRFGYHIVKTVDRRPARGEVRVAHIMLRHPEGNKENPELEKESEAKAREIYKLLQDGADFADMAMKHSQDNSTARNGGELPWFGTGKMVDTFEEASFALKNDGDISEPVRTDYGWHIIKRLESKPVPSFEEMEADIRRKVSRDTRADMTRNSFLRKLEKSYGVTPNRKNLKPLLDVAAKDDSTFVDDYGIRLKSDKGLDKELFSIQEKPVLVSDFYAFLQDGSIKRRGFKAVDVINTKFDEFLDAQLMAYEDSKLESKHNEFRLLMSEYHDGILLFELTDRKVWSKAVRDSSGIEEFYQANKNLFMWKQRATANVYTCANKKIAGEVEKMIRKGKTPVEIKDKINAESKLNVTIEENTWERGENPLLDKSTWSNAAITTHEANGQFIIVQVIQVIDPMPKGLDEARGMITAEYQNHLERQWINSLREKYRYTVNYDVLHGLK